MASGLAGPAIPRLCILPIPPGHSLLHGLFCDRLHRLRGPLSRLRYLLIRHLGGAQRGVILPTPAEPPPAPRAARSSTPRTRPTSGAMVCQREGVIGPVSPCTSMVRSPSLSSLRCLRPEPLDLLQHRALGEEPPALGVRSALLTPVGHAGFRLTLPPRRGRRALRRISDGPAVPASVGAGRARQDRSPDRPGCLLRGPRCVFGRSQGLRGLELAV